MYNTLSVYIFLVSFGNDFEDREKGDWVFGLFFRNI